MNIWVKETKKKSSFGTLNLVLYFDFPIEWFWIDNIYSVRFVHSNVPHTHTCNSLMHSIVGTNFMLCIYFNMYKLIDISHTIEMYYQISYAILLEDRWRDRENERIVKAVNSFCVIACKFGSLSYCHFSYMKSLLYIADEIQKAPPQSDNKSKYSCFSIHLCLIINNNNSSSRHMSAKDFSYQPHPIRIRFKSNLA